MHDGMHQFTPGTIKMGKHKCGNRTWPSKKQKKAAHKGKYRHLKDSGGEPEPSQSSEHKGEAQSC